MKETIQESVKAFRLSVKQNGYHPVPVQTAVKGNPKTGKRPLLDRWNEVAPNLTMQGFEPVDSNALNTGILTHDLYAIDQDTDDQPTAGAIAELIVKHFGSMPLKRFRKGSAQFLALFRSEGGIKKQRVGSTIAGPYLEVLSDGQQFVADGTHYSGAELQWEKCSPVDFPKHQLPLITKSQMLAFLLDVRELFATDSFTIHGHEERSPTPRDLPIPNESLEEDLFALVVALPADSGYDEWARTIGILHRETNGSAFGNELAHAYSQKSTAYDRRSVDKKWEDCFSNPFTKSTLGSLIKRVRDLNPDWVSPSRTKHKDVLPDWESRKALKEPTGAILKATDAPVYQWVSDVADSKKVTVNAGGRVAMPSGDKLIFKSDLLLLNSLRGKSDQFGAPLIETALDRFVYERKMQAEEALRQWIRTDRSASTLATVLGRLEDLMCLGTQTGSTVSPGLAARVMAKTIWQVKRKLHNLPVTRHLMVVFVGGEGSGKTWLTERFTSPVAEMRVPLDFAQLCDERSIDIFGSVVGIMDEMARAARSDIETLKNIITADTISRRPMRSNSSTEIRQRLTLIGTANKGVDEMIVDETSNRRFFQVEMLNRSDPRREEFWNAVNGFDWLDLWRVIDETGDDPTESIRGQIADAQYEKRNISRIEQWLEDEHENVRKLFADEGEDVLTATQLFRSYDAWSAATNTFKTSTATFSKELRRVEQNNVLLLVAQRTKEKRGYALRAGDSG